MIRLPNPSHHCSVASNGGLGVASEEDGLFRHANRPGMSPGFIGQGIITGPIITIHMLMGTVVGWGILSP